MSRTCSKRFDGTRRCGRSRSNRPSSRLDEVAVGGGHEVLVRDLEIGLQGLQLLPRRVAVRFARENLLELDELAESSDRVEVHLDPLETVDLAGLADLGSHGEDMGQDLADRLRVRDRGEEDPALLYATDVGPLIVDELTLLRTRDRPQFEASFPQTEIGFDLADRGHMFRAHEEGPRLSEVLVTGLQLDEFFLCGIHRGGDEARPQEDCRTCGGLRHGSEYLIPGCTSTVRYAWMR